MANFKLNQKGSVFIGLALVMVVLGSFIVMQMASAFIASNKLNHKHRDSLATAQVLERLAVQLKQSHQLAILDSTCASFSGSAGGQPLRLRPRSINGIRFCLPQGQQGICAEVESNGSGRTRECIASSPSALNWQSGTATTSGSAGDSGLIQNSVNTSHRGGVITNSITVPPETDPAWRGCLNATCVRLALCPEGETNCSPSSARAIQIVRLGEIGDPVPPEVVPEPQAEDRIDFSAELRRRINLAQRPANSRTGNRDQPSQTPFDAREMMERLNNPTSSNSPANGPHTDLPTRLEPNNTFGTERQMASPRSESRRPTRSFTLNNKK